MSDKKKRSKKAARQQRSAAKSRELSDRFNAVVRKHMKGSSFSGVTLDSELMLVLVGAGLASFAPSGKFVLHDGGEPVEFSKKEVKRAGENLIADWLLGSLGKVMKP